MYLSFDLRSVTKFLLTSKMLSYEVMFGWSYEVIFGWLIILLR